MRLRRIRPSRRAIGDTRGFFSLAAASPIRKIPKTRDKPAQNESIAFPQKIINRTRLYPTRG